MALVVWKGIIDYRWSCPTDSYWIINEQKEFNDSYRVTWQLGKLSYYYYEKIEGCGKRWEKEKLQKKNLWKKQQKLSAKLSGYILFIIW